MNNKDKKAECFEKIAESFKKTLDVIHEQLEILDIEKLTGGLKGLIHDILYQLETFEDRVSHLEDSLIEFYKEKTKED